MIVRIVARAHEGVTDAVPSAYLMRASSRHGEYSERFFASDPLAGLNTYLDLAGRMTVSAGQNGSNKIAIAAAMETNDVDATRLGSNKIPWLR